MIVKTQIVKLVRKETLMKSQKMKLLQMEVSPLLLMSLIMSQHKCKLTLLLQFNKMLLMTKKMKKDKQQEIMGKIKFRRLSTTYNYHCK